MPGEPADVYQLLFSSPYPAGVYCRYFKLFTAWDWALKTPAPTSWFTPSFDLGIGLGSILLGLLSKKVGLSSMYLACSFMALIPMAMFYLKDAREYRTGEERA
ncbi:MAG: hypothetical protein ACOY40_02925 [Bacillota bacterium]